MMIEGLSNELIKAVLLGADYLDNGIPLKDAMNQREINQLVWVIAKNLNAQGYQLDKKDYEE